MSQTNFYILNTGNSWPNEEAQSTFFPPFNIGSYALRAYNEIHLARSFPNNGQADWHRAQYLKVCAIRTRTQLTGSNIACPGRTHTGSF